mgnify:CR=1 FL=1
MIWLLIIDRADRPARCQVVRLISRTVIEGVSLSVNLTAVACLVAIDRRGQKTGTSSRNGPRNAGNASNFTPGNSRPDSMFDCARGLRSNYTRFSRVRSTKESWPFRHRWPFVIRFRPVPGFETAVLRDPPNRFARSRRKIRLLLRRSNIRWNIVELISAR